MAQNNFVINTHFYNGTHLRHSFYWFCATFFLIFETSILKGSLFRLITNKVVPDFFIIPIEYSALCISFLNTIYFLLFYLAVIYNTLIRQLFRESEAESELSRISNRTLDESARVDCIKSLCGFMRDFFKLSTQTPQQKDPQLVSEIDLKNTSMSSLVGYHDSPLNKMVTIHTTSQLKELLANETCDSIVDPSDCTAYFTRGFYESHAYMPGTSQNISIMPETATEGIQAFLFERNSLLHEKRGERRIYYRNLPTDSIAKAHVETNIKELLNRYGLDESNLETLELKLRIWHCNTILRPLVEKIDELNATLGEKFTNLHARIGHSSLEVLQTHKADLCNTWLPFLLPYLRVHNNQQYVVSRIQTLAQNIALEDFKWNSGGENFITDENNAFNHYCQWNEQLPTDTELIWHFFCTYMDFHLSPSSNAVAAISDSSKPFSNIYFIKSTNICDFPLALKAKRQIQQLHEERFDEFFIRMSVVYPPCFEMAVDGGNTILLPLKDTQHNFWLTMILFLAHTKKAANGRIGHVHIDSLSLNIFNL